MRVQGWPRLLNQYLRSVDRRHAEATASGRDLFEPGVFDCCIYVADWVELCTGVDPMSDYRDRYRRLDAGFALLKHGDRTLYNALRTRFGNPVHPAKAQRGDIAYRKDMLGIVFTSGSQLRALFLGQDGMSLYRPRDFRHAFRVR